MHSDDPITILEGEVHLYRVGAKRAPTHFVFYDVSNCLALALKIRVDGAEYMLGVHADTPHYLEKTLQRVLSSISNGRPLHIQPLLVYGCVDGAALVRQYSEGNAHQKREWRQKVWFGGMDWRSILKACLVRKIDDSDICRQLKLQNSLMIYDKVKAVIARFDALVVLPPLPTGVIRTIEAAYDPQFLHPDALKGMVSLNLMTKKVSVSEVTCMKITRSIRVDHEWVAWRAKRMDASPLSASAALQYRLVSPEIAGLSLSIGRESDPCSQSALLFAGLSSGAAIGFAFNPLLGGAVAVASTVAACCYSPSA